MGSDCTILYCEGVLVTHFVFCEERYFVSFSSMEFFDLPRGGKKPCFNGHSCTRKANKKNRVRWECLQRAAFDCKGAVMTSLEVSLLRLIQF